MNNRGMKTNRADKKRKSRQELNSLLRQAGVQSAQEALENLQAKSISQSELIMYLNIVGLAKCHEAIETVVAIIGNTRSEKVAYAAAQCIHNIGSKKATRPLMTVVSNKYSHTAMQAGVYALWFLKDKRAIPLFSRLLADPTVDDYTRGQAAEALGLFREAKHVLYKYLRDPSADVRCGVFCALALCARSSITSETLHLFLNDQEINSRGISVSQVALSALGPVDLGGDDARRGDAGAHL